MVKKASLSKGKRRFLNDYLFSNDAIDWAIYFANSTVDALIRIDDIDIAFCDAIYRAIRFAIPTSDTSIENFSWHNEGLLFCIFSYEPILQDGHAFVNSYFENRFDFA